MREIKFRAFENGTMYRQVRCGGLFDGIPTAPTTWNDEKGEWLNLTGQPHTIVMQYTGLKDKKGVEICEGDIVKNVGPHSATVQRYGFKPFSSHGKKFVVTKELVGFTLRHVVDYSTQLKTPKGIDGLSPNGFYGGNGSMPPIDNYQFWNYQSSFEIIGNIYENPELIGEQK